MRLIGYWMLTLFDEDLIMPQQLVRPMDDRVRAAVGDYLDRAEPFVAYGGCSWCRFNCGAGGRVMGSDELADGYWAWPRGLSHYVRTHGVTLPDEFVRHALSGVPPRPRAEWGDPPADLTFWEQWCREQTSDSFRERVRAARDAAAAEAAEQCRARRVKLEAELGRSDHRCQESGCTNRALKGRAWCAACTDTRDDRGFMVPAYFDLSRLV